MKHVAAYLLLSLGGNKPTPQGVKELLGAMNTTADSETLDQLFANAEGKTPAELIAAGQKKFVSLGGGSAAAAPAAAGPADAAAGGAAPAKAAAPKVEEEDTDFGMDLF